MKRFLLLLFVIMPLLALAHSFEKDGIYYQIESSTNVYVTYSNNDKDNKDYEGDIVIPDSVVYESKIYKVTNIGEYAFNNCTGLTSIKIPQSVTRIGSYAFAGCTFLRSLTIPENVKKIYRYIISGCRLDELIYNAKNAETENDIRYSSFNSPIEHVIIGDNVETIPNYFVSSAKKVTIGKNVKNISEATFSSCHDLTELVYNAKNATYNGTSRWFEWSFTTIEKVTIGEEVETIPQNFLYFCKNVKNITLPSSITKIEDRAFSFCQNLAAISIPDNVITIGVEAFNHCDALSNVTIGNSVISIGKMAFSECSKMTELTLGQSVTTIGDYAFQGCKGLTSVEIPNSVIYVMKGAFIGCVGIQKLKIPKSVTSIGDEAFNNFTSLQDVYVDWEQPLSINSYVFRNTQLSYVTLHVPEGTEDAYKSHYVWKTFGMIKGTPKPTYKLIYKVDDDIYNESELTEGSIITPLEAPTKEGYTFSGWSEIPQTMPAHDVTITGSFSVNSYKLTYMVDGEVYRTDSLAYGAAITPLEAPSKEGHTFSGWSEIPETMPAHDVTITGSFAVNSYKLTYLVDGEVYRTDSLAYGATITPLEAPTKEGYTFSGWSEIPETMPAHDVTITGSFSVNSYKLTYMVDGEVYRTDSLAYGAAITPLDAPTKEGYTFSGWSEIPETMPAHDVTITGSFSVNSYKLTYMVDGEVYRNDSLAYGATITPIETPTKEGYTFSGWSEIPETMPAHDVTITGSFAVNSYKLTYMVDGEVYRTDSLAYGAAITPLEAPSKEGYTFSGWSEIPQTMPAHDVTITGSFAVNSYKLTYMVDGEVYRTDSLAYGAAITPLEALTKEGYTFSGWSEIPTTMPAHDVTITGSFAVNSYKLTYLVDGEVYRTDSLAYGSAITPLEALTKEGYTFSGWSEIPQTMPAHDVTITGNFSVSSYKLTYMVDGEVYRADSLAYGATITPLEAPTKEGYTFSGWSEIPETMPAHDVTVTGSFSVNSYKLTYMVDGEDYRNDSLAYGATITPLEAPTKEGYTFSGWSEIPETMPAHDVTITGSFAVNSYKLTYMVDDEDYRTDSLAYGAAITPLEAPTKEGYTFSGWSEIPETMPAHDVTITGSFAVNSYKLTYMVDGEVYRTDSLAYGATITPLETPTKEGYTFSGWSEIPQTMPAHDVTVSGTFTPILVSYVTFTQSMYEASVGDTIVIEATVAPVDALNKVLMWSSSNTDVVSVDHMGHVICLHEGSAVVTATAIDGSGKSASAMIVVSKAQGLEAVKADTMGLETWYSLDGSRTENPRGMTIQRNAKGAARIIFVK